MHNPLLQCYAGTTAGLAACKGWNNSRKMLELQHILLQFTTVFLVKLLCVFWQHKSFSSYTKLWGASCCPGDGDSIRTKQWRKIGAKVWTNLASSVKFGSLIRVKEPSREQEEELSMTRNKNGSGSPDFGSPSAGNRTRGNLLLITMESIQLSHRQPWLTSSVSSYLIFARIFV